MSSSDDAFLPPSNTITIWAPLLQFIQLQHTEFALVLGSRICSQLVNSELTSSNNNTPPQSESEVKSDPTYLSCLARWANWVCDSFTESTTQDLRRDMVAQLLQDLGRALPHTKKASRYVTPPVPDDRPNPKSACSALELASILCKGNEGLESVLSLFAANTKQDPPRVSHRILTSVFEMAHITLSGMDCSRYANHAGQTGCSPKINIAVVVTEATTKRCSKTPPEHAENSGSGSVCRRCPRVDAGRR